MPRVDGLPVGGPRGGRVIAGTPQVRELDHGLGGEPRVFGVDGLLVGSERGIVITDHDMQDLSQVQQRVPVPGVDGPLVGGAGRLGRLPVQEITQVHQRLAAAGISLPAVKAGDHLRRPDGQPGIGFQNAISNRGQLLQGQLAVRVSGQISQPCRKLAGLALSTGEQPQQLPADSLPI